ncbi:MAG: hypothetical protein ACRDHD_10495 [Candidatus Limnocylindria bacterium]
MAEWVVFIAVMFVVLLVMLRLGRGGRQSTVGHYDPDAVLQPKLNPYGEAGYHYEIPGTAPDGHVAARRDVDSD